MCSARGVEIRGNGNTLDSVRVFSNGLEGVSVLGNANVVTRSTIGDKAKGNGASGVSLAGTGNTVRESGIYANGGSGVSAAGGLHQLIKNTLGDIAKVTGSPVPRSTHRHPAPGEQGQWRR